MNLVFPPREFERSEGTYLGKAEPQVRVDNPEIPAQGFCLHIKVDSITLDASDAAGLFYGRQAFEIILKQYADRRIPCCRITDWPDFASRGYMLDVSRGRVPTMKHLFHLVDCLTKLRYNQLQLYTEHTFAYSQHETVWANASPLTAAEIRELDQYCRERHIELVANQNSFGHMERWLEHDAYKHLAECPEGFRHPISGEWRPQGSVIKPDAQSLEFLNGLYAELLPNFSSRKFNIGGDEPWELGFGASEGRVQAEGKHKVYADFLAQVCELATRHGAEPMCWADVLLEEPSTIENLPDSIRPIIWGYEAEHPFEEQCATLAKLGRDFYVAPGDSTWTSYTGRLPLMLANVRAAACFGKKFGASGLLMTHWGDGGHPQTWPISLPGMVWSGLCSWNADTLEQSLEIALEVVLGDENGSYSKILLECGTLDASLEVPMINRSYLAYVNQLDDVGLATFEPKPKASILKEFITLCREKLVALRGIGMSADDSAILQDELELVLRLNLHAAQRSLGECTDDSGKLRNLYDRCWHYRSRPGGVVESLSKIHGT